MNSFQEKLQKYAELSIQVGVNVQPGQLLQIMVSSDNLPFARLLVKEAYKAGAKQVFVEIGDDELARTRYEMAPEDTFGEFPEWKKFERDTLVDKGAAFLFVVSQSPDLFAGIDPKRIGDFQKAAGKALEKYRKAVQSDKNSWSIVAAPSEKWAEKVFPDLSSEEQVPALWDAIFKAVRVDQDNPVEAWKTHDATLHEKVDYLNNKKYSKLHYTAPGTDLTIELPKKSMWVGASSVNENGHPFMANMPTEEVFTVPSKSGVNGYVSSTKPLSYGGNIIDNFKITFENGQIVKIEAEQGQEILQTLIDSDEGSKYLGEVALVPHQSPISSSGVLFFNTLFDENASNHLAIGSAYAFCVEGGKTMSEDELKANDINQSVVHVDFMIGSDKMDIDGIKEDGTTEPIFRDGNWAF